MVAAAAKTSDIRRARARRTLINLFYAVAGVGGSLLLWEFIVWWMEIQVFVVPAPTAIFGRLAEIWPDLLVDLGWTLLPAGMGLAGGILVGTGSGVLMAQWKFLERSLFPIAVLVRLTPFVALVPILIVWLEPGLWPKVIIALLITFFPFVVNSISGLRAADLNVVDLVRTLGGSEWEIFRRVRWPSAKPYLFPALKLAVNLSLIGAIVAEFFGAKRGIGRTIFLADQTLDMRTMFAAIFVLAATGVTLTLTTVAVERWALHWHESIRSSDYQAIK